MIGVEAAIVLIAFVIVAAALAFVVLNMGFTTSQKTKTTIISGLSEAGSSLQVSGTITGVSCLTGISGCDSSLVVIAIPLKISSGGNSVNLDATNTIIKLETNSVEYSDIYNGVLNPSLGFLYVVDEGNERVQVFDTDGTHKISFGSAGSSNGQFDDPREIAVDVAGNMFVADRDNDRIQLFDSDGTYLSQFGTSGTDDGEFTNLRGITVDTSGKIYVTDESNENVQIFDSSGTYLSQFGTDGTGNGQFGDPAGIKIDSSGRIIVSDTTRDRVQIFDSSGTYLSQFGSSGSDDGEFNNPIGIAIDSSNKVYVVDRSNENVQIFDSSGTYLSQFGSSGSGNGQFNDPEGIAIGSDGKIYVTDGYLDRVQIFDSSGTYLSQFGSTGTSNGEFDTPRGIVVTSYDDSFISTFGLASRNGLITSIVDSSNGAAVSETGSWIYWTKEISSNSILDQGEHALLVIAFKSSDKPSSLDKISVEIIPSTGSTLSIERQVPTISNGIIDLG